MKTVIEMAREAGLLEPDDTEEEIRECGLEVWLFGEKSIKAFERFAELVRADERERIYFQTSSDFVKAAVAEEREACAGLCDRFANRMMSAEECADAIRARSNT